MVITLQLGLLKYDKHFGGKDGFEESVATVNCAVWICEVTKQNRQSATRQ